MSARPIYRDVIAPNDARIRQELIKRVQAKLGGSLIAYTANPGHPFGFVMSQDALLFEDLLRTLSDKCGYLMLTSPGGDPNASEKLLVMCRKRFTEGFCVVIPNYAKSAGTMIALGSDKILMGYLAELGPIDPQLQLGPMPGPSLPARSFIDGLENIRRKIKDDGDPVQMYVPMLSRIRPELIAICQSSINDSRTFAAKWLKQYMLKNDPDQAEKVANWLSGGEKYKSHGKVIDYSEAKNVLKLNVEEIDKGSEMWDELWELHARSVQFLQQTGAAKLFENEHVSLSMNIEAVGVSPAGPPQPPPTARPPQAEQSAA
jgi:ClpP class serine protease